MSLIAEIDQILLERAKKRIEQLAGLPVAEELTQKDFDFLVFYIQDKTGQALSLTTIKRIWRNEFQRLPHLSTLNMVTQLAFGTDWHTFKKETLEQERTSTTPAESVSMPPVQKIKKPWLLRPAGLSIALCVFFALAISSFYVAQDNIGDTSKIPFSARVTADLKIPNSVVFSYDIHKFESGNFLIQQSWDPAKQVAISKDNTKQTDIYYEPGYHYAKLMGNGRVLKEIPVHIKYNDWFVRFRFPDSELLRVKPEDLISNGRLGLKPDYLKTVSDRLNSKFQLGYMLSREFSLSADDFRIEATVKFDSIHAPACPVMNLLIKGDKDYAWITIGNKGCESNLGLRIGDTNVDGKTNDLTHLGISIFDWQHIGVKLEKSTFRLLINGKLAHELSYENELGQLKEVDFFFNGIGSIDDIKMTDAAKNTRISRGY